MHDLSETRLLRAKESSDSRFDNSASCAVICSGEVIERGSSKAGVKGRVGAGDGIADMFALALSASV